jgi:hypothetical protein
MVARSWKILCSCLAVGATASLGAFAACGGTTGREGLTPPGGPDATADDGGVDIETGAFDAPIEYADRALPDVHAPSDAGAEAGPSLPDCPPFLPIDGMGHAVPVGAPNVDQVPAVLAADGGETFAPDGSVCATYPWLGSTAIDECVTSNAVNTVAWLPPCSWCVDAGSAVQGPGAGVPLRDLCFALYTCIMQSGCGQNVGTCLCGPDQAGCVNNPMGPCVTEELAALQYRTDSIQTALQNYEDPDPAFPGYCGSVLNALFQNADSYSCFPLADAGGHD